MERFDHKWIIDSLLHRKILLFWAAVIIFLPLPWLLKGCEQPIVRVSQSYDDCSVLSIHDGDTMTASCNGQKLKIRLYCIDAPEMAQSPWGRESRDHLRSVTGNTVSLVVHDHDRYGRTIGEVFSDGINLNLKQVQDGWAADFRKYCTEPVYSLAEATASASKLGIWSSPGLHQTPWVYRRKSR